MIHMTSQDMLRSAHRSQFLKSGGAAALVIVMLAFALKGLSSGDDRRGARIASAAAQPPSSCSVEFALSLISRRTGCGNSLAQAQRP